MTAAGIVSSVERANRRYTVEVINVAEAPQQPEAPALNVSTVTARRLAKIAESNRIRAQAGVPLLSIPRELRRMKDAADAASFREFAAGHMVSVRDEVLERVREATRRPNWRPTSFMAGLAVNSQVNKILRERFNASRSSANYRHFQNGLNCASSKAGPMRLILYAGDDEVG